MISEEELKEIELRCAKTLPEPWKAYIEGRDHENGSDFIRTGGNDIEMLGATEADYDFIANARQDIPRLVQEIRGLKIISNYQ